MRVWGAVLAAVIAVSVLALPKTSAANDLFTLDPTPTSTGHVIVDAAGNAYVGWVSRAVGAGADVPKFCKIAPGGGCAPISLPVPGGTLSDSPNGAFPVFGPGSTIYVVGPRFAQNDIVFWTSTDGGVSFDTGTERNFYSSKTNPTDVFLQGGTNFLVGAYNAGVGFSTAEVGAAVGGVLNFANPGTGGVISSSMGLAGTNPVIAYSNLSAPFPLLFYRFKGGLPMTSEANWEGPIPVTSGYEPSLADGPAGLFMVSQDYTGGSNPDAINVRRFEGTTFGAPRTLAVDATTNLFVGGAIAQSPSGNRLAVAWPGIRAGDRAYVMRLFTSTDGGLTYAESQIARLGSSFAINHNADLATNDSGAGWIVFNSDGTLRIADLSPIAGPAVAPPSPAPSGSKPSAKATKVPPIFKGKSGTVATTTVGDFLITLRLPKSCLQSRQRFFVGVGKRKRRQLAKKLGGEVRIAKVVFVYDGRRLRVKKRKPFRYLVDPGSMASGSVHVVKTRVTLIVTKGEQERKVKRVLKGTVRAC